MPSGVVSVHRPHAVVFDILGTASKSGFLERILFPFLKSNLESYINTHWDKGDFIKLYKRIKDQSSEFNKQEPSTPLVVAHADPQAKTSLLQFINFVTDNGVNSPAVTQLRFKVWFEGYQQSRLRTPIYSDVPQSLKRWYAEGIKFYVFSNTWVEAQKALLRNTNHGDLTNLIAGYFDNDFGSLTEPDSWRRFCAQIGQTTNNVLFLTKSPAEGRAAQEAGLAVVLVLTHRHNVKAVAHEDRQRFPYVRTMLDLGWTEGSMQPGQSATPTAAASEMTAGPTSGGGGGPSRSVVANNNNPASGFSGPVSLAANPTAASQSTSAGPLQASGVTAGASQAASSSSSPASSHSQSRQTSTSRNNKQRGSSAVGASGQTVSGSGAPSTSGAGNSTSGGGGGASSRPSTSQK